MNPRKREASEPILPLRAPKQPRLTATNVSGQPSSPSQYEGLAARWLRLGGEMLTLLCETVSGVIDSGRRMSASGSSSNVEGSLSQEQPPLPSPPPSRPPSRGRPLRRQDDRPVPQAPPHKPYDAQTHPADGIQRPRTAPEDPPPGYKPEPNPIRRRRLLLDPIPKHPPKPMSILEILRAPIDWSQLSDLEPIPLVDDEPVTTLQKAAVPAPPTEASSHGFPAARPEDTPTSPPPILLPRLRRKSVDGRLPKIERSEASVALASGLLSPPPSQGSSSSLSSVTPASDQDETATSEVARQSDFVPKRKLIHREHIYAKQHKAKVKENLLKGKEEMVKELFKLRRTKGYGSDFRTFQGLLKYQQLLEVTDKSGPLSPSPLLAERRDKKAIFSEPIDDTPEFLQRALQRARDSLSGPKIIPFTPTLDQLRVANRAKDAAIDRKIHGPKPLPSSLPPEDDAAVTILLEKTGVIAKCVREQVTDYDLKRLEPTAWLNDEIINFYGQMLLVRSEECKENPASDKRRNKPLNIHYFSTFFWSKLKAEGYEKGRLAKWTKKHDIFSKDVVLIPVNHNNAHWTTVAINFRRKRIESYDSMGCDRGSVFKLLRVYLDAEHINKKKVPFDFTGWKDYIMPNTPQQENGWDCGVFTCQFMESLSRGEETFSFKQTDMPYLRRRMIWEIGHVKLRDDP